MTVSRGDVLAAYELLLERAPEGEEAIDAWLKSAGSKAELREGFFNSAEYQKRNFRLRPSLSGMEPPIHADIDTDLTAEQNRALFNAVKATWTDLGDVDPYWAVLSMEEFHGKDSAQAIERFYESGAGDIDFIEHTLARNNITIPSGSIVVEYGCGLGRVTSHLAKKFASVVGVDISKTMVEAARARMLAKQIPNVSFLLLEEFDDIDQIPTCDLLFSLIVLQHSPPPLITRAVRSAIRALNTGGIAIFQAPTYIANYNFVAADYISGGSTKQFQASHGQFEMHAVRQSDLFSIVYSSGGEILEIFEDNRMGTEYQNAMSNTFVVRKR